MRLMGCRDRSALRPLLAPLDRGEADRVRSSSVWTGGWLGWEVGARERSSLENNNNELELKERKADGRSGAQSWSGGEVMTSAQLSKPLRRLSLLVWKNLLLRKRHYVVTAFEILLPTLFAILLAFTKAKVPEEVKELENSPFNHVANATVFPEFSQQSLIRAFINEVSSHGSIVAFAPNTSTTSKIIEDVKKILVSYDETVIEWRGFINEIEIVTFGQQLGIVSSGQNLKAAIIFEDGFSFNDGSPTPKRQHMSYKIRLSEYVAHTNLLFPSFQLPGPSLQMVVAYKKTGFSGLQVLLDKVLIETMTNKELTEEFSVQAFPYPPFSNSISFTTLFTLLMPMLLSLGFVFLVPSVVRGVVGEKETGIRELMKMMGLSSWMHWLGWMINSMLVMTVTITLIVILLFYPFNPVNGGVLEYSDPSLWWAVLFVYLIASTAFCFFISSFFQRPTLATSMGIILWFVSYFAIANPLFQKYDTLNLAMKLLACLVPNVALTFSIKIMGGFEGRAIGAHWGYLFEPMNSIDSLTLGHILLVMLFSAFGYICLTLYVENVLPSQFGVRKPWYYIFKKSTWCMRRSSVSSSPIIKSADGEHRPSFEADPVGISPGVEMYKLKKIFSGGKVAVNDVSLKIFDGQITALLGHNGAGKTTTMSMLTGMFAPTGGTAIVNGHDIGTDLEGARQDLGLCPQHNMLFDKLTVAEHLIFFGRLKGLTAVEARVEARSMVKKLQLTEKFNKLSVSLSGGQKRKLNLGMALIGGSKIVILDEPTSGMDPEARRAIWDLLLDMRGHRTIILTTHFMEEADVLGDRIAIMAEGRVQCCGSPMFLKRYYGAGYTLSMTLDSRGRPDLILLTVQKHVENASMKSQHAPSSAEIAITLPTLAENTTRKFPAMFGELQEMKEELGIRTIGLSLTTMDEVFIRVGTSSSEEFGEEEEIGNWATGSPDSQRSKSTIYDDRLSGWQLMKQQFYALFMKRYLYSVRKKRLFISQLILPVVLLIVTIYVSNQAREVEPAPPPLSMSISDYKIPVTLYSANTPELGKIYASVVGDSAESITNGTVLENLVQVGEEDLGKYRERYIVGAEIQSNKIKALFSTIPYHASPLSVNLASNTFLKKYSPENAYSIKVTSHPLVVGMYSSLDAATANPAFAKIVPVLFAVMLPIGLALLAASFIVFPVEEKLCKAKQLQLMTGVNPLIFWGSSLAWDFIVMTVLICVMITCFPIFQDYGTFTAYGGAGVLFLILLAYGFAAISFSYVLSLFVSTVAGGFSLVTIIHVVSGMVLCIVVYSLELGGFVSEGNFVRSFARFFPTFGVSITTMQFTEIATLNSRCLSITQSVKDTLCNPNYSIPLDYRSCCVNCLRDFPLATCFSPKTYINWEETKVSELPDSDGLHAAKKVPGIGQELVYLTLIGFLYQVLLIIIEYGVVKTVLAKLFKASTSSFTRNNDDDDVTEETSRVRELTTSGNLFEDAIVVHNLCKSYGSFSAVSNISFGVHHGECFGLLGVNGAGKTTTFRMLTGDEILSQGSAYTSMCSLESDRKRFLANIGYCPQFDGIISVLSGKEMLELFSRLRGVPSNKIHEEASKWLTRLGLAASSNVECGKFSGGMKRRLSTAMALIGDPPVVMLDEPTSGVDPVARRQFWKVIAAIRQSGQAVILTSHSMEECEALCSRLAIMVNGQMQCLGGVQHLKNKFAQGFSIVIKLKGAIIVESPRVYNLTQEVGEKFHPCLLKDKHQNILHYQVLNVNLPWNTLFTIMEDLKSRYDDVIEDYSVNETTLEEVFLSFARKQYPNRQADVPFLKKLITGQCCQ